MVQCPKTDDLNPPREKKPHLHRLAELIRCKNNRTKRGRDNPLASIPKQSEGITSIVALHVKKTFVENDGVLAAP
jgi:hypothetical protein